VAKGVDANVVICEICQLFNKLFHNPPPATVGAHIELTVNRCR
jgi:hypothetical protein